MSLPPSPGPTAGRRERRKQLRSAGTLREGNKSAPGVGRKCTDLAAPLSRPESWFANENARAKWGSWALHRPSARGGPPLASRLCSAFWARGFRPCWAPFWSRPRGRTSPKEGRFLCRGKFGGLAGPVCPSRAGPGPLPLTPDRSPRLPGRIRALGSHSFLVQRSFFPRRKMVAKEGSADSCTTSSRNGLCWGVSPQAQSAPRYPRAPSPSQPGADGCPARGGCFPQRATPSSARPGGIGAPVGAFYRPFFQSKLEQGAHAHPRLSALHRGSHRGLAAPRHSQPQIWRGARRLKLLFLRFPARPPGL